jgi:NADH-quinone oxidoreductase subunit J
LPVSPVFYLIAFVTLAGSLASLLLRRTVHCALAVTVAFAGLAMLFLSLDAQFAGLVQILIYIGAVAILVIFAILLTRSAGAPRGGVFSRNWPVGVGIAVVLFAVLGTALRGSLAVLPHETAVPAVTVRDIGDAIVDRYVLPLEILALLLTAATIGGVIIAVLENGGEK